MNPTSTQQVEALLKKGKERLNASSLVFYVRDPLWTDQLLLISMPGVTITEPMYGFISPADSLNRVVGQSPEGSHDEHTVDYFRNAENAVFLRGRMSPLVRQLAQTNPLFGDFVQRENVGSCARARHFSPTGKVDAVLWINFSERDKTFEKDLKDQIELLTRNVVDRLPGIVEDVQRENTYVMAQLLKILESTEHLTTADKPLNWYLRTILNTLLQAFEMDAETGLGSIHLYAPLSQTLRLEASTGDEVEGITKEQNMLEGRGIISWVGAKQRALLIQDLSQSNFRDLYLPISPGFRSELAVPMIAGDDLLGVINLESKKAECPFKAQSVRLVWYAASQAAIACRLAQQAAKPAQQQSAITSKLLEIAHKAVVLDKQTNPLDDLATLVHGWLGASDCYFWQYQNGEFRSKGGSYKNTAAPPRPDGWSQYIRRTHVLVWISNVAGTEEFSIQFWNPEQKAWLASPPQSDVDPPAHVHPVLLEQKARSELGLPILVKDRCIGIAWFKFWGKNVPPPSESQIELASGFAAQAGLVMDVLERYLETSQLDAELKRFTDTFFSTSALDHPLVEGYVIRQAHGRVGGDFHAIQRIGNDRIHFLVGDAQGHGIMGAVRMLPIITAFNIFSRESGSTTAMLWRLRPICERAEEPLHATAVCFTIAKGPSPVLFVSSAGHPPLMIMKPNGETRHVPDVSGQAYGTMLGVPEQAHLFEEDYPLSPGDLVVAYTDGVSDALDRHQGQNQHEGQIRIQSTVLGHLEETPRKIAEAILAEVIKRSSGAEWMKDDITILVLRIKKEQPRKAEAASAPASPSLT